MTDGTAQVRIPDSSGFGGFVGLAPGYYAIKTNMVASGPPLLDGASFATITSITDPPKTKTTSAIITPFEINYTIGSSRTMFFVGNRLEDLLRMDIPIAIGVRQELGDQSTLLASMLVTPLPLYYWKDPYTISEDRQSGPMQQPGGRVRWWRPFGSNIEISATARKNQFDDRSGTYLVERDTVITADQKPLLDRNGWWGQLDLAYRLYIDKRNTFEPTISYREEFLNGDAMSMRGTRLRLAYLYHSPSFTVDVVGLFSYKEAKAIHPVYGKTMNLTRVGAQTAVFIPIVRFDSSILNLWVGAQYTNESSNIDFFRSQIISAYAGVLWRVVRN